VGLNSGGKRVGDGGIHYFSREVVNKEFERFGAGMIIDLPKELAKELVKHEAKLGSWKATLVRLWAGMKWWFKEILA
jgi:hypothetical protein